ncbi:RHS repeat protein [Maribacter polysiphoniae]|uniref:RHS repeat protein n=1 Tax=Maribacter polysiphoniae TaxID=429344 RepID=A0A316EI53_9FLAO|nr:RHS repeat domain-containing protein [Maribacter polysiphoniae]MBD1261603.1 RHS repeat protein [Maribacter polysiphoniae]PWK22600.1 YD repeat-containing protein [Maribacter polysiphoniae]
MKILYLFFMCAAIVTAQETDTPKLPQIFPVSPEAASLGKYGDLPVNLSTGKINYSVPLYTIKVKDFEWPIYLSYNYSGLMVEEDPGYTGLGWDLMATGRITRDIKGIPDEMDVGNNFKNNSVVPYLTGAYDNLPYEDYEDQRFLIYNQIAELNKDGQYDNYVISAGEVNGTFKINHDNEIVFLNHRNYIAEKDFVIDEKGIKYYFDEIELAEYNISLGYDSAPIEVPSSYLLTKIELPNNGGEILFEYEPFNYATDVHYKKVWSNTEVTGIENRFDITNTQTALYTRLLKKIVFPNGEVRFTITPHDESFTNRHGPDTKRSFSLDDISVYSGNNQILKYDFVYNNASKSKKLLKEIVKSKNSITEPFYTFDYNNESFSINHDYTTQDFWGYYNGKSASNLLLATREIDTVKTRYGALETITYPTGGSTVIGYEQNKVYNELGNTSVTCSYTHNANRIIRLNADEPFVQKNLDTTIDVGASQIVRIVITAAVKKGTTSNALGNEANISVTAKNASELCGQSVISNFSLSADAENCASYPSGVPCWDNLVLTKEITGFAEDGIIYISGSVMELANKEAYIECKIYYENIKTTYGNKNVGGIRVASTTDCDNLGNCYTKKYKYENPKFNRSSGVILGGNPKFEYSTYHQNEPNHSTGHRIYRSAKSKTPFTSYQGSPVLYERVVIEQNNGENGYTVNTYSKGNTNSNPGFPFLGSTNYDWEKGKLRTSWVYKEENGLYKPIRKTINKYSTFYPYGIGTNNTRKAYGMAVGRTTYRWTGMGRYEGEPNDYAEDYNTYYARDYKLVQTVVEDIMEQDTITTTIDYEYDEPYTQLIEKITTNSKGETLKQKVFYPYSVYGNGILVYQNRLAIPIQTMNYKVLPNNTEQLLSAQQTLYYNSGLPKTIRTLKGPYQATNNPYQDRIDYDKYDAEGNPIEVSISSGPPISYIWGYDKQYPVAKVENATYADVIGTGITESVYNNSGTTDSAMRTELNKIRTGLPTAMVTTYTYDPLVGVTSITDPKGYTIYYYYDGFNRLKEVKDAEGKLVTDYEYHYKNQ